MSKYANKRFWIDTADRVIATTAQAAVGSLTANAAGVFDLDLPQIASVSLLAGATSLLTSIAFRGRDDSGPVVVQEVIEASPVEDDGTLPEGVTVEYGDVEPVELPSRRDLRDQ